MVQTQGTPSKAPCAEESTRTLGALAGGPARSRACEIYVSEKRKLRMSLGLFTYEGIFEAQAPGLNVTNASANLPTYIATRFRATESFQLVDPTTDTQYVALGVGAGVTNVLGQSNLDADAALNLCPGDGFPPSLRADTSRVRLGSGISLLFTSSTGPAAVPFTESLHFVNTTGTGDALTLANVPASGGLDTGRILIIVYQTETAGTDTAILTPTSLLNGTTVTFNAVGDSAFLMWVGSWIFLTGTAVLA